MGWHEMRITKLVKKFDRKLYAERSGGVIKILRESTKYDLVEIEEGLNVLVQRSTPHFVCALTQDWTMRTAPVEWGLIPIWEKFLQMDSWNRDVLAEVEEKNTKHDQGVEKNFKNSRESFLREIRKPFARDFNDVNTSNLAKIDRRRIQDGSRK